MNVKRAGTLTILLGMAGAGSIHAETTLTEVNVYGLPGYVEMPSAASLPDAEGSISVVSAPHQRGMALTFQVTPRMTAAFRYAYLPGFGDLYDRSFDLHYRLFDGTDMLPAIAVGMRDFIGTGVLSSEYVVASKQLTSTLSASAGIGWGRLGSHNSFANPLGLDGREMDVGLGGKPSISQWFHGPAAIFAGARWQPSESLGFDLEYSSDAHSREVERGAIRRASPLNFGVTYQARPGLLLSARYLHGSELALGAAVLLNPKRPLSGSATGSLPIPVLPAAEAGRDSDLVAAREETSGLMQASGLRLAGLDLDGSVAYVSVEPTDYRNGAQAIGRAARILSNTLPPTVGRFVVRLTRQGVAPTEVTIDRVDLEASEYSPDPAATMLREASIVPAQTEPPGAWAQRPRVDFGLKPYIATGLFDPDAPLRADIGVRAIATVDLLTNLSLGGAVRSVLAGNRDSSTRTSTSPLPHVRSDAYLYAKGPATGLDYLTADYVSHLATNVFVRASLGYLEPMFAGVSTEVLWWPVSGRLAFGMDLNHVWQRDTDGLFGIGQYDYDITTGHLSVYYAARNGFDYQLDVGRYLAGDFGTTFTVERTFENGWRIGAFATLTDVSFEEFGEGSFDKGIRLTIPLDWLTGRPSREEADLTIRPIQRDGGARLQVRNRLHGMLRDLQPVEIAEDWGSFWR